MNFWRQISKPIVGLSPMDGVTDASFRFITAKHGGPDVTVTEFVNIQSAFYSPHTLLKDFAYTEIERPVVAQIYGRTPGFFYKVAHIVGELGFDGLDINMGCPAKKVAATGCGAALIRTPDLARDIIHAAKRGLEDWCNGQHLEALDFPRPFVEQIQTIQRRRRDCGAIFENRPIPVSVKTRLGYDRVVIEEWLQTLLAERPAAVSLHGRTLQQGYKGEADWDAIGRAVEIAKGSGTLVLGNGDLQDLRDADRRVRQTQVDGVLIGRGAQGDPWLFRGKQALKDALRRGTSFIPQVESIELAEKFRVVIEHCEHFETLNGRARFAAMRKHLTWYCRNFRGAAELRGQMTRANSAADVRDCLAAFLARSGDAEALRSASPCSVEAGAAGVSYSPRFSETSCA
ncbi:MAG: tRNA dihydrouridine synthase [Chloroflexota bacterium]